MDTYSAAVQGNDNTGGLEFMPFLCLLIFYFLAWKGLGFGICVCNYDGKASEAPRFVYRPCICTYCANNNHFNQTAIIRALKMKTSITLYENCFETLQSHKRESLSSGFEANWMPGKRHRVQRAKTHTLRL
jgi:hypothetical protein